MNIILGIVLSAVMLMPLQYWNCYNQVDLPENVSTCKNGTGVTKYLIVK